MDKKYPQQTILKFKHFITAWASQFPEKYLNLTEDVKVGALDDLIADTLIVSELSSELEDLITHLNKTVMTLQGKAGDILKFLNRKEYESPLGRAERKREWRVSMPQDEEEKMKLFAWMKGKGIFEAKATVHANSLNSLYRQEWEAAQKTDPEAAVTFSMPGIAAPKFNEYTKIKKVKPKEEVV